MLLASEVMSDSSCESQILSILQLKNVLITCDCPFRSRVYILAPWLSTILMLRPFNTVPYVW